MVIMLLQPLSQLEVPQKGTVLLLPSYKTSHVQVQCVHTTPFLT